MVCSGIKFLFKFENFGENEFKSLLFSLPMGMSLIKSRRRQWRIYKGKYGSCISIIDLYLFIFVFIVSAVFFIHILSLNNDVFNGKT